MVPLWASLPAWLQSLAVPWVRALMWQQCLEPLPLIQAQND